MWAGGVDQGTNEQGLDWLTVACANHNLGYIASASVRRWGCPVCSTLGRHAGASRGAGQPAQ